MSAASRLALAFALALALAFEFAAISLRAGAMRIAWTLHTNGPVRSSPAVTDDRVYIGSDDGFVYAIDRATGRVRWQFAAGGPVNATPAVNDRSLFVTGGGFLRSLRRSDGHEQWRIAPGVATTTRWGWKYF